MDIDGDTGNTPPSDTEAPPSLAARIAILIGGIGLLGAMATDSIAVLGRHTGFSLLGSIEVVQTMIVLLASASIVLTTLEGRHAAVHILTERLAPATAGRLARMANGLSAIVVAVLLIGTCWLIGDLWGAHERSELLQIPFRVLRLFFAAALVIVVIAFLRHAFVGARR